MIRLKDLRISFKDFQLGSLQLEIPQGAFFMLMGPTGSGKTLLLETIAGLVKPDTGTIEVAGTDVTGNPPGRRSVAIVYQETALFPHLSVRQNITYGVRYSLSRSEYDFDELVKILNLQRILDRLPGKLSGGEKQRTALARALITGSEVILLDEPLSSLDQMFKGEIRNELKRLHNVTGTTFMMTTHDFADALSMGTHGAVIRDGKIEQEGTIDEIFYSPSTPFMASFIGMKNVFSVEFNGDSAKTGELSVRHTSPRNGHGFIAVPPESVVISCTSSETSERNRFSGIVRSIENMGLSSSVSIDCSNCIIVSHVTRTSVIELKLTTGSEVYVSFKASSVHVF